MCSKKGRGKGKVWGIGLHYDGSWNFNCFNLWSNTYTLIGLNGTRVQYRVQNTRRFAVHSYANAVQNLGKTTDSKSCKSLTDAVFRTLHDLVVEGPDGFHLLFYTSFWLLTTVQCAKRVSYSALTKYGALKETLQSFTSRITSSLQCALWRLFQLRYPHHGAA